MEIDIAAKSLENLLKNNDWFTSVGLEDNRLIAYVRYMGLNVFNTIPQTYDGRQVLVHFEHSKETNKHHTVLNAFHFPMESKDDELGSLNFLNESLDALEEKFDSNVLEHIFYEVHDKQNAITNLSSKYPEARQAIENLYNKYGFDTIYNYLEL